MRVGSTDEVTIAVHNLGGAGEPLLICHATGFCARAYEPLAAELANRFAVFALDFRAHGDSTSPANRRFDWEAMAEDLEAVIDALGLDSFHLVGHSMGGAVALLVETRRPGTLRSAYVFEPIVTPASGFPRPAGGNPMADAAARRRSVFPSKDAALMRYASKTPLGVLRADALAAYVEHGFETQPDGSAVLKCPPEDEAATFNTSGGITFDTVREVTTPTTVAVGSFREGEFSPAMFGPTIVASLPHGRLEEHPTLGHFGPLQDPSLIAAAIVASIHG